MKTNKWKCLHCGNKNQEFFETNGEEERSPYLEVMCVALVPFKDCDNPDPELTVVDEQGLTKCGWQFAANP
jgi:hypothetical protein